MRDGRIIFLLVDGRWKGCGWEWSQCYCTSRELNVRWTRSVIKASALARRLVTYGHTHTHVCIYIGVLRETDVYIFAAIASPAACAIKTKRRQ